MTNNSVLHENENYKVVVTTEGYALINKSTAITEKEGTCLPEIIGDAENSNSYLKHEAWRWVDAQIAHQVTQAAEWFSTDNEAQTSDDTGSNLLN